jgi:ABC-type transport system involved in multi-copper enzyme maturation permease subunit
MLHILRKDLRRLRWLLIVWAVIFIVHVALVAIGSATAGATLAATVVLREVDVLLPLVQTLMLALLVARLVHEEPLVGLNAFWLTRPYSRGALLTAKLLFIVAVMVLVPLVADVATMTVFKVGVRAQLAAVPTFASSHVIWALGLCVVAVLTPSLATFVMTIIGTVMAIVVLVLLLIAISFAVGETTTYYEYEGPMLGDPTPGLIRTIMFIGVALGVIAYQYRHRRVRVAAAVAVVGLLASTILPTFWPWPFLRPQPLEPPAWTRNVAAAQVRVHPRFALDIAEDFSGTGQPPKRRVHAVVELIGKPADVMVQGIGVNGTLRLDDGTTLRSRQNQSFSREEGTTEGIVLAPSESPAHAALGSIEILNDVERRTENWAALLSLTQEEHARHKGKTGRFEATLRFHLDRTFVRAALPVRAGATVNDGLSRIEVVRAQPIDGGYRLVVRHWRVVPVTESAGFERFQFFLRNRRLGNAVHLGEELSWSGSFAGGSHGGRILSAALPGWSFGSSANSGFFVQTQALQFPWRIQGGVVGLARLNPEWFDEAELVVLQTAYAGPVTRSVTIADFRIPEA